MNKFDYRFSAAEMAEFKSMIGKKMVKFKCDPFEFSTAVYGIVGVAFEDSSYAFTNQTEVLDYYGTQEDVALFKMQRTPYCDIRSMIQDQKMVETPVDSIVSDIILVNERQSLFEKGTQTYEVLIPRGIIFVFEDGHELSFEKSIWFSEDISVERGYHLIDRFTPTSEFIEGWSGDYRGECSREVLSFKDTDVTP